MKQKEEVKYGTGSVSWFNCGVGMPHRNARRDQPKGAGAVRAEAAALVAVPAALREVPGARGGVSAEDAMQVRQAAMGAYSVVSKRDL